MKSTNKKEQKVRKNTQKNDNQLFDRSDSSNDPVTDRLGKEQVRAWNEFWITQDMYREDANKLNLANSDSLLHGRGGSTVWVDPTEVDYVYDEEDKTLWRKSILDRKKESSKEESHWRF